MFYGEKTRLKPSRSGGSAAGMEKLSIVRYDAC
jgi:hypothetical protein